jgi:hypothetical protein
MAQETELQRVKARIKALTDKTVSNGCTEAEAMSAAELAGRLLERYALCMDEIDVRESACVEKDVKAGGQRRKPIDSCVPAIARFCDCKVWLTRSVPDGQDNGLPLPVRYVFFGFEADVAVAVYLFEMIGRAIGNELNGFRQANPTLRAMSLRQASFSFQYGMVARIAERLNTMHRDREAAVAAQRHAGMALSVIKHQTVEDAFSANPVRLVSCGYKKKRPAKNQAFRHGWDAGARVNLNRPVESDPRRLLPA